MTLSGGARLGHFEILGPVGAGGMGEVYKARDTRLDRTVAIKVLPAKFLAREEMRQRFEREARAVSRLNHPNICTLYDIGEQDGTAYLVMELLDGEPLSARIKKGAIPVDQALRYAADISDALDYAHRHDITHRDLKPANIMVTSTGVKLLDFGLAKITRRTTSDDATLTQALTTEGAIMGTYQYMAPEQLEAKDTDARTDIFAFGAVLFEMLTGQRAFQGSSQASLIASIMATPPAPVTNIDPPLAPAVSRLIRRCLARNPDDRWQTARDLASELRWIGESSGISYAAAPARPSPLARLRRHAGSIAAAILLPFAAFSVVHFREQPPQPKVGRFEITIPEAASLGWWQYPSVSPDGSLIVLSTINKDSSDSLWLRPLASHTAQKLPGRGGWDHCWSPDSKAIVYASGRSILKLDIGGGEPRNLVTFPQQPLGVACSPRAILTGGRGPLFQVPPGGGESKAATQLDTARGQTGHYYPQFLPDGVRFLFTALGGSSAGIYVGSLDSPDVKLILAGPRRAVFAGGYLLYPSGRALVAQRFDPASLTLSGEPVRVAETVHQLSPEPGYAGFSASPDVLVHREHEPEPPNELVWYDRSGKRLGVVGAPAAYTNPALSPDGRRLAIGMEDPASGKRDVWVMDLARGTNTRLTFDPDEDFNPLWSPDGNEIYFTSERSGTRQLYRKPASGVTPEQPLNEGKGRHSAEAVSPDGKMVLYNNTGDLWMAPSVGGKGQIAVGGPGSQDQAAISPDGKWIAYRSTESGRGEIYVQNFPPAGGKWQISTDGGYEPAWRGDGRELYYVQRDGKLMAVSIAASGASLEAGKPVALFQPPLTLISRRNRYVVTRDGSKFLAITEQQVQRPVKFNVVVNWAAGLPK